MSAESPGPFANDSVLSAFNYCPERFKGRLIVTSKDFVGSMTGDRLNMIAVPAFGHLPCDERSPQVVKMHVLQPRPRDCSVEGMLNIEHSLFCFSKKDVLMNVDDLMFPLAQSE